MRRRGARLRLRALAALDAFGRWDARWYLEIAAPGTRCRPARFVQSSLPSFPLPVARAGRGRAPAGVLAREGSPFLAALLVSNLAALGGLALLWRLARAVTGDEEVASRTVLYTLVFPFGFILSAAYPSRSSSSSPRDACSRPSATPRRGRAPRVPRRADAPAGSSWPCRSPGSPSSRPSARGATARPALPPRAEAAGSPRRRCRSWDWRSTPGGSGTSPATRSRSSTSRPPGAAPWRPLATLLHPGTSTAGWAARGRQPGAGGLHRGLAPGTGEHAPARLFALATLVPVLLSGPWCPPSGSRRSPSPLPGAGRPGPAPGLDRALLVVFTSLQSASSCSGALLLGGLTGAAAPLEPALAAGRPA